MRNLHKLLGHPSLTFLTTKNLVLTFCWDWIKLIKDKGKEKRTRVSFLPQSYLSESWRLLYFIISTLFSLADPLQYFLAFLPDLWSLLSISYIFLENVAHIFLEVLHPKQHSLSGQDLPTPIKQKELLIFSVLLWFTHLIEYLPFHTSMKE